jgi:hypothetical protein
MAKWRDIPEYEDIYQVSDDGRVRSLDRMVRCKANGLCCKKGKELKLDTNHAGYLLVRLSKNGKMTGYSVHRLVASAFIPNPDDLPQVHHKNHVKADNRANNLTWVTNLQNQQKTVFAGNRPAKLTPQDVIAIRELGAEPNISWRTIGVKYGISGVHVGRIINGTRRMLV